MLCQKCGRSLGETSLFCRFCGKPVDMDSILPSEGGNNGNSLPPESENKENEPLPTDIKSAGSPLRCKTPVINKLLSYVLVPLLIAAFILGGSILTSRIVSYRSAEIYLKNNFYNKAKELYLSLGNFMDSEAMAKECTYQQAMTYLSENNFDGAKNAFISLGTYKDSSSMIITCTHERAKYLKETGSYFDAYKTFIRLRKYKDSDLSAGLIKNDVFNQGVSLYRQNNLSYAKLIFTALKKDGRYSDYLFLISMKETQFPTESDVKLLMDQFGLEDASQILAQDKFITYFLKGTWKTTDGKKYFIFNSDFFTSSNIPSYSGKDSKIENSVFYIKDEKKGWIKQFDISLLERDKIKIYSYKDKNDYILDRHNK